MTNEQWDRLAPLLPPQRPPTGRPAHDHRAMLNGIWWVVRTRAPWRDLSGRYGSWASLYSRFRRWKEAGIWDQVLAELQAQGAALGELDWVIHIVDGSNDQVTPSMDRTGNIGIFARSEVSCKPCDTHDLLSLPIEHWIGSFILK